MATRHLTIETVIHREQCDIERRAAQLEYQCVARLLRVVLTDVVGEQGGCGLVNDAEYREARFLSRLAAVGKKQLFNADALTTTSTLIYRQGTVECSGTTNTISRVV